MALAPEQLDLGYTLEDKYARERGRIYLSGVQALVRLPLVQAWRDRAQGLRTAGFVSGYRGSPLGGYDQELWRARKHLERANIRFQPGLNEDLAATMVWGTQQVNLFPGAQYDGVFAIWYGKGPGVDRCGDVFKHANAAGTSRHGGVLALAADDHACRSSTLPHASEHEFVSALMPVLNPAGVEEILDFGVLGFALSRYTGRWVGFKVIAETVESSASIEVDPERVSIRIPDDFELPPGGLNIRWPDPPLEQELRLHQYAMQAAQAFARANGLDRIVLDSPRARFGIITTGKSYLDVLQALEYLGLDAEACRDIGIRLYKVGMTWPLEPEGVRRFVKGLTDILVVEEKRSFIESQLKEYLYNLEGRPTVVGKYDEHGEWILPSTAELTPARIARIIARRLKPFHTSERIEGVLEFLKAKERELALPRANFPRVPHYCAGCPHNTSTKVPEGSRALGGIGCHYMVTWMDRRTDTFTHMGGEGVTWAGQAPFTSEKHVFQNLGDGTYFHSGSLAIRQAIAAGVNITYKILYNDAVAMTGGQPVDGVLTVPDIARQMRAEGVKTIVVVSDEIEKWNAHPEWFPDGTEFFHRDCLDEVQRRLRETPGVSILIYDQTCATEKRRRRKRGKLPDPKQRVFIHSLVCEGCGDCGVQSFCVAVLPKDTEYGRKREIDQSNCNKDFSCVKGFCPSFVTVEGAELAKPRPAVDEGVLAKLPEPQFRTDLERPWNILVTGVGGTGVVTIGALLGMAAHLEGKGATVLDQTGLAQKGGAVTTHVRIARGPGDIHAVRIAAGEADLVLGCDMVVVNDYWSLSKIRADRSQVVLNTYESMPGSFTTRPDLVFPREEIINAVRLALAGRMPHLIDATELATALLGDAIAANCFMLGYAWQLGLVPVSSAALDRAIELNGAAVAMNRKAFAWGRLAAIDPEAVRKAAFGEPPATSPGPYEDQRLSASLDELIERRVRFLSDYQHRAYAERYRAFVERVRQVEGERLPGSTALTEAVARYLFKLMAYKDEYEVARLYAETDFLKQLRARFDGPVRFAFHLAPPLLARRDGEGNLIKRRYGGWMRHAFRLLAKLRFLRGTALDVFGYTAERRKERALIERYRATIEELLAGLTRERLPLALDIARLPERIRGFGHVKERHLAEVEPRWEALLDQWRAGATRDSLAQAA